MRGANDRAVRRGQTARHEDHHRLRRLEPSTIGKAELVHLVHATVEVQGGILTERDRAELARAQLARLIGRHRNIGLARHYLADLERWRVNERARVSHILFQVTEKVDLKALRQRAQQTLDELLHADGLELRFVHFARTLSNCPSGVDGGALGEIGRGDTVAAFERAVFAAPAGTLCPVIMETEFGFHIVRVHEKSPGMVLPFEQVELRIRVAMSQALRDLAERRYVMEAVARANIQGWKDGVAT